MIVAQFTPHGVSACGITVKPRGMSGAVGPLCRGLIAAGHDPDEMIQVNRGEIPCLMPTRLGWYADRTCTESDAQSVRWQKYKPFTMENEQ
jgi:hypothetical protein